MATITKRSYRQDVSWDDLTGHGFSDGERRLIRKLCKREDVVVTLNDGQVTVSGTEVNLEILGAWMHRREHAFTAKFEDPRATGFLKFTAGSSKALAADIARHCC